MKQFFVAQLVVIGKFGGIDLGNARWRVPAEPPIVELMQRFVRLIELSGERSGGDEECAAEPQIATLIDRSLQPMDRVVVIFQHEIGAPQHPIVDADGLITGCSEFDRIARNRQRFLGPPEADELMAFCACAAVKFGSSLVARSIASYPS